MKDSTFAGIFGVVLLVVTWIAIIASFNQIYIAAVAIGGLLLDMSSMVLEHLENIEKSLTKRRSR